MAFSHLSHDSHFATSHFQLSASPTNRIMLFDSYPPNILSIDIRSSLNDHDHSADDASLNLDDFLSYPADDASLVSTNKYPPLLYLWPMIIMIIIFARRCLLSHTTRQPMITWLFSGPTDTLVVLY
ncbi:unnamed protein product [Trifolium pratense]|uniref:Uncharacterized protein n=1 Tax=Trifolium pratense TaxID=57577 RepID=A0ACB0KAA4_TRIPR|nr:unnamed protein product [Trifolium pratense]